MIDSRYGLKYSFPHTLVHIVDNSMYTGELPVTVSYDPSLFATIVVTGMPMGVDNKIVTVTRSDVLNVAFGANTLTASDVEKYGQAVEYPASLIEQNAPVKLLRVTPPDAAFATALLYIEWKSLTDDSNNNNLEIRFQYATSDEFTNLGMDMTKFTSSESIAKTAFSKLSKTPKENNGWNREVLVCYVSAGRGSAYNNYTVYINEPTYEQRKKYANVVYNFGTIDTRHAGSLHPEVEAFTAALVNFATKRSLYGVTTTMEAVNAQMRKRLEASSVIIPYVNEKVITTIYNKWCKVFKNNIEDDQTISTSTRDIYKYIYDDMDVNKFDVIFGKCVYSDYTTNIPYLTIDTLNNDVPRLDKDHLIKVTNPTSAGLERQIKSYDAINAIYDAKIIPFFTNLYGFDGYTTSYTLPGSTDSHAVNHAIKMSSTKLVKNVTPGTMYLINPNTKPTISIVTEVNPGSGNVSSIPVQRVFNLICDSTYAFTKSLDGKVNTFDVYKNSEAENHTNEPDTTTSPVYTQAKYSNVIEAYYDCSANIKGGIPNTNTAGQFINFINANYDTSVLHPTQSYVDNDTIKGAWEQAPISDILSAKPLRASDGSLIEYASDVSDDKFGSIIALGYIDPTTNTKKFKLAQVATMEEDEDKTRDNGGTKKYYKVKTLWFYPENYYTALDFDSTTLGQKINERIALASYVQQNVGELSPAFQKIGALMINNAFSSTNGTDLTTGTYSITSETTSDGTVYNVYSERMIYDDGAGNYVSMPLTGFITNVWYTKNTSSPTLVDTHYTYYPTYTGNNNTKFVGDVPDEISLYIEEGVNSSLVNVQYDVLNFYYVNNTGAPITDRTFNIYSVDITTTPVTDTAIWRFEVTRATGSAFSLSNTNDVVPYNYYTNDYGVSTISDDGNLRMDKGSTGFFDDDEMSTIEFKLRYSDLLVKAFRGNIDPRILSPIRVPAKFLFDAGYNTTLNIKSLPYSNPTTEDVVYASTIFTDDEKEEFATNRINILNSTLFNDIDVKQAMYDLMIERCYQRIPKNKRPIGPGSGLQLHLDSGYVSSITGINRINESFKTRFDNPNASWDIGGYTSAVNGVTYTYVKRLVDNFFRHFQTYTINKPYVNTYSTIYSNEYTDFYPNIDATDWELEELMYTSGGNSWVMDINGDIRRKSQRTLYRESTGTSDLLQENNMRTLSQLIYLLQNKLDDWLLEYVDDGILTSMEESINNIFSGWVGTRVEALGITFTRDLNTDGGEIVICNVNVTFRGLLLRVPIIVNVNRREI